MAIRRVLCLTCVIIVVARGDNDGHISCRRGGAWRVNGVVAACCGVIVVIHCAVFGLSHGGLFGWYRDSRRVVTADVTAACISACDVANDFGGCVLASAFNKSLCGQYARRQSARQHRCSLWQPVGNIGCICPCCMLYSC